jgi:hypothetical protein
MLPLRGLLLWLLLLLLPRCVSLDSSMDLHSVRTCR